LALCLHLRRRRRVLQMASLTAIDNPTGRSMESSANFIDSSELTFDEIVLSQTAPYDCAWQDLSASPLTVVLYGQNCLEHP
jgi:hypothetical protein